MRYTGNFKSMGIFPDFLQIISNTFKYQYL